MTGVPPTAAVAATRADRLVEALANEEFDRARELLDEIDAFLEAQR